MCQGNQLKLLTYCAMLGRQDLYWTILLQTAGILYPIPPPASGQSSNQMSQTGNVRNPGLESEIYKEIVKKGEKVKSPSLCLRFADFSLWQLEKKWLLRQTMMLWLLTQIGPPPKLSRDFVIGAFSIARISINTLWVSIWAATDNDAECLDWSPLHRSQLRTPDTDNTWLILITPDSLTHIKSLFNMAYVKMFFC